MAADIVELGFRVDTSDIDRATQKFSLIDREFGKVERSSGLVSRSFESVGDAGKKSGGLVSRAFREASQDLDKTLRSVARLASELGDLTRISRVDIDVRLNTQSINRELSDLRSRLGGGVLTLDINADLTRVTSEIASLRQSGGVNVNVTATADTSRAIAEIDVLKRAASDVTMNITATADTGRALAELHSLRNQAGQIRLDIDVNVSGSATSVELNNVRDSVLGLNQAVLAGTRYLHDYNNELDRIRGSASDAADAIRRAADEQERLRNAGGGAGGAGGGMGQTANAAMSIARATTMAVAAVTAMAAATAHATGELLAMSRELENAERQLGISSQTLQVWGIAADKIGLSSEKMRDIFKDVSDKLGDFATTGGGEAKDIIERLNLDINELINLSPDQALLKIAKAMEEVKNISQHDKIFLMEALADEGSALLPLLKDNAQALRDIEETANRRGVIITSAEEQILTKANALLSDMKSAASGVSQELGLMGAELMLAFGGGVASGLDNVIEMVRELRSDIGFLTEVWAENTNSMLSEATRLDGITDVFAYIYDAARQMFAYLPVMANAAFTAAHAYGEMFGHGAASVFLLVKAAGASALAAILDIAGGVFGGMASMAGKAVGFILDRFADMVSGLSGLGGFFAQIPGLEGFGAAISSAEGNIKAMANTARASGDAIGQSFAAQSASFKAVAADSLAASEAHKAAAGGAKMAAAASLDYAKSYVQQKEVQRETNALIRQYNDDLYGAASVLDRASNSNNKFTSTAKTKEAAEKAGKAATDAAKKANEEAKKAIEALADAQEKIADLFTKEAQKHDILTLKLNQGADAARALELQYQTTHKGVKILTDAKAAELVQMENANKAIEEEIKKRDDLAKAVEKADEAVAKSETAMAIARDSIYANDEALRALTLSHEDGYSKAAAQAQAHSEALTESFKNQRDMVKDLAKLNAELASADAQMAALKSGGLAAMEAEKSHQSALNDLKEKGVAVESALGQQYLAAKTAIEAKNKALEAEQAIQANLRDVKFLDAEIAATRLGSAALAESNVQKEIKNKLDSLGLTQESELGKRIAETTRQLAAKNKQLQLEQSLRDLRTENAWLEKEITATQQGEKALKALNIQKRISEELDRQGIAAGTQAAAQITSMIQQQEDLKEKLASIQELRQPISQFFGDVLSNGKDAFKNLSNYILNWLKKMIVEFATNKLMLSIGVDATGKGGLLGGIGDKITGIFGGIGKTITSAVTGLFGTGGLGGILGSIAGALGPIGLIAGAASLLKGLFKKEGNLVFSQGMQQGQQLTGQGGHAGQEHYRQTALGLIGATSGSNKIGRQEGFVPEFHKMMDAMVQLDAMIAKTIPNSIEAVKTALSGLEMKGFSTAEMLKQRYATVLKALPEELQKAMSNGKDLATMSAEEIVAAFQYMSQVAESGLIPTLQQLGLAGNQSNESLLAFGIALSTAMGGIDKAKAALDNYYQAAYTDAERTAATQQQAKTSLDAYNQSLGFSGAKYIDTIAELRAYIEAQDKNTEAGQTAIAAALGMVDALKTLGGTAEEAAQKIKGQWDAFNDAAYTDAQKQQIAQNQAKKAIDAFNQSLGLTGNKTIDNIIELRAYMRTLDGNTEAGRKAQQAALGMTSAFVAFGGTAEQIKQKIAGLRESIKGLVSNLYSSGSSTLTSTSTTTADSNQAALSAAQANLDSLRSQLNSEQDRIAEVNNQAKEAYQNQLDYFRTLKDAAENLRNVANGFADDARSAADVLKSAQLDYNRTLQAAKSGDVEAAKKLGDMATRLKSAVSVAYNNDGRAASAIQQIEDQLRSTAGVLDGLAGSQPNDPGTITSTLIASLQSQISAQESVVNSLQSIASNASSATNEAKAVADRAAMAKELATKIGELGLATDKSAWQILTANGINIKDLAKDFGINVNKLDATFVKNTADLATRLNVNSLDLLTRLNVNFSDLAKSFNIDVNNLNNGTLGKLDKLADQLHVSSVDLAAKLGINIDQLGDLMANKLAALPNIPADIKAKLAPHLQDIRNAADPATLQRELKELQAYINTLPPGIRAQLNGQLDGILGYTGDTKTNTADTKAETLALRTINTSQLNTRDHVNDLKNFTRDNLMNNGIALALQNSRALNQHAAKIGKESIPSYAVGSDKLPSDMLANVHRGEMIFTAAQSNSMRDLALYNQRVIPQIASYLSEIAANDAQAPVFIQPVYVAPVNSQRRTDSGKDELLEEVKGLRKDNAQLKKAVEDLMPYQFAIANNTRKSAAMMDKWDTDGQPEERVA